MLPDFECCPHTGQLRAALKDAESQLAVFKLENLRLQLENEALNEQLDVELQEHNHTPWYDEEKLCQQRNG